MKPTPIPRGSRHISMDNETYRWLRMQADLRTPRSLGAVIDDLVSDQKQRTGDKPYYGGSNEV